MLAYRCIFYWTNFNKRITKTPKLYFYDIGLACSLLEIDSAKSLSLNPLYGNLFEGFILSDFYKQFYNQGLQPPCYFWRDKNGAIEVDCLIAKSDGLIPIEIKSGETYNSNYFNALKKWSTLAEQPQDLSYVVYGGDKSFSGEQGNLIPWQKVGELIKKVMV